jgi:hypothetical protein
VARIPPSRSCSRIARVSIDDASNASASGGTSAAMQSAIIAASCSAVGFPRPSRSMSRVGRAIVAPQSGSMSAPLRTKWSRCLVLDSRNKKRSIA